MLLVQEYLMNKTFGDLAREHGVYASFSKSGHKFSLNYDQIEARESDPLAQECRGLILSCKSGESLLPQSLTLPPNKTSYNHLCPGETTILAYPMRRFFNHGQGCAAQVNWSDPNLSVLEKLDGTLCIVYFDQFTNEWCVATRSVPEADLLMDNGLFTFRTLFEKAVKETVGYSFDEFTNYLSPVHTYCFELTTPYNRIVVDYKECRITLLALRNLTSLVERDPAKDTISSILPVVKAHTYSSVDELVNWVSSLNPMEHEGVVVRDSNFNRIKVKNAAYVAYNKLHDRLGSSERNCMEFVLLEKDDDVAPFLPEEIVKNMQQLKSGLVGLINQYDETFKRLMSELPPNPTKRDFAINLQKTPHWQAPFFSMFDGKASNMKDFIQKNKKDGSWGNSFLDKLLDIINS